MNITGILSALLALAIFPAVAQQDDFAAALQSKLKLYYQRHIPAKIHVTFNQPLYAAGDTAFYKLNFFTADNFAPVAGRQILNVQLIGMDGKLVHAAKILVIDGTGFNQIPIAPETAPGRYTVVAFSEVMKEYDPGLFFQRTLWIAGPQVIHELNAVEDVDFFPEGGQLVSGISNKIVATGPPNTTWKVFSDGNLQVGKFTTNDKGLAIFLLNPDHRAVYTARSENIIAQLPAARNDRIGLSVHVPANLAPIRVTLEVPENSPVRADRFVLAMTSHGSVYYTADISFDNKSLLTVTLPQANLPEGIARITVFTNDGSVMSERMVYVRSGQQAELTINAPKQEVIPRDSIPISVEVSKHDGSKVPAKLAVTVFNEDFLRGRSLEAKNLVANAFVFGDLAGPPQSFAPGGINTPEQVALLDNYLVTRQWRRFEWQDVWSEVLPRNPFPRFLNIHGKAFLRGGSELPDSTLITFFLQKHVMTYVVDVRGTGEFELPLLMDFYGEEEIFYRAESDGKIVPDVGISLNDDGSFAAVHSPAKVGPEPDSFFSFASKRAMIEQSYRYHSASRVPPRVPSLNALVEEEVIGADVTVNLDDYYLFPSMVETLREIVPMLQHRTQNSRDVVRIYLEDVDRLAEGEPLFIIDGVITDNTTWFLNLRPADIFSIKIVHKLKKLQSFGSIGRNGIVLVETKIPGNSAMVPRSEQTLRVRGLERDSPHHYRQQAGPGGRVPDLRSNLYWNPDVRTDASGMVVIKVPASDVTGTYRVMVEGFTEDGEPVFGEENFRITAPD